MWPLRELGGLVVTPAGSDHAHLDKAVASGIPVVLLDRALGGAGLDSVVVDNRDAAQAAVTGLTDRGHTGITVITCTASSSAPASSSPVWGSAPAP
ncbi:hypothetical protein [Streptomyces sp. NPDC047097]|uniref:hypothetical protein n=1 Tax=Streptomyces sp. NPDC047097 TaxID=3155260 RepID=UPI0033F541AC